MDECRKAFEEWAEQELIPIDQSEPGMPHRNYTLWECWRSAWEHRNKHPENDMKQIDELMGKITDNMRRLGLDKPTQNTGEIRSNIGSYMGSILPDDSTKTPD